MTESPLELVRQELRTFAGYSSARLESPDAPAADAAPATTAPPATPAEPSWLNANESPWRNPVDPAGSARRYPDPQPQRLRDALAALYGCRPEQLLAGRGSDEAIDLIVRALCRPGAGTIVITTPTFGMYAVSAHLNATEVVDVPQRETAPAAGRPGRFDVDIDAVALAAESRDARVVFLASPGNPSGAVVPLQDIRALADRLAGRALVVVDEAYLEFADSPSATTLLDEQPNIAVLRTLSKAHALAGARVGAVMAHRDLIGVLARCQAPYPLPVSSVELACAALEPTALQVTGAQIDRAVAGRERLALLLGDAVPVTGVYESAANFVLARFRDPSAALTRFQQAGVIVRDLRDRPGLGNALRISVGTDTDLGRVEDALGRLSDEPAGTSPLRQPDTSTMEAS